MKQLIDFKENIHKCSKCGNEIAYNSNFNSILLENAKVNKNGIICSYCL